MQLDIKKKLRMGKKALNPSSVHAEDILWDEDALEALALALRERERR